LIAAAQKVK